MKNLINNILFNKEIITNTKILDEVKKNIYLEDTILNDLYNINKYEKNSKEYNKLKELIINVDEFKN